MFNILKKWLISLGAMLGFTAQAQSVDTNLALQDLSYMFFEAGETNVVDRAWLDHKRLDFSVESLKYVNQYLDHVRTTPELEQAQLYFITVLRAGAYTGEVIRKQDQTKKWVWLDFEAAKKVDPKFFSQYEKGEVGLMAVLYDGEGFAFPIAKVQKYIQNGEEDDLSFFAQVIMTNSAKKSKLVVPD